MAEPTLDIETVSAGRRPRLAAVVLSFGHVELTARAVACLQRSRRPIDEIVVVDNDPASSFRARLGTLAPPLTYLPNAVNLGFSAGINCGLRHALAGGAERLLIVNSDAELPADCVERLEKALEEHPEAGLVAPVLLARSDPTIVASAGFSFSRWTGRARQIGFGRRVDTLLLPAWQSVTATSGCVQLLRRELLERAGLFDEEFFFSFEDLELCLRARRTGFDVGLVGDARVLHEGGASLPESSPARLYFATRNHLLAAARGAPLSSRVAHAARALTIVALNVAHAALTPAGPFLLRLRAVAAGVRDYANARFGPRTWAPRTPDDLGGWKRVERPNSPRRP